MRPSLPLGGSPLTRKLNYPHFAQSFPTLIIISIPLSRYHLLTCSSNCPSLPWPITRSSFTISRAYFPHNCYILLFFIQVQHIFICVIKLHGNVEDSTSFRRNRSLFGGDLIGWCKHMAFVVIVIMCPVSSTFIILVHYPF